MKPKAHQALLGALALFAPAIAAGWTNNPSLWLPLASISCLVWLSFNAAYRRFRPWAIEQIALEDGPVTPMSVTAICAEAAPILAAMAGGLTGWTVIGLRGITALVQLAEIGRLEGETKQHQASNEQHSRRKTRHGR